MTLLIKRITLLLSFLSLLFLPSFSYAADQFEPEIPNSEKEIFGYDEEEGEEYDAEKREYMEKINEEYEGLGDFLEDVIDIDDIKESENKTELDYLNSL